MSNNVLEMTPGAREVDNRLHQSAEPPLSDARNNDIRRMMHLKQKEKNDQVNLLVNTVEHLTQHLDLDGQLRTAQQVRAGLEDEARVRATIKSSAQAMIEAKGVRQKHFALTGELPFGKTRLHAAVTVL